MAAAAFLCVTTEGSEADYWQTKPKKRGTGVKCGDVNARFSTRSMFWRCRQWFTLWMRNCLAKPRIVRNRLNIASVPRNKPSRSRRKLTNPIVRTAITAYFTEQEKQDIALAAERQGISMSAFVAAAALKDARISTSRNSNSSRPKQ